MANHFERKTKYTHRHTQAKGKAERSQKKERTYPKATVATTTCVLDEIQSSKTELRDLLFNPA